MTNFQIALAVFLQIAFVLSACRLMGVITKKSGQPQVVAEMLTGLLMGPSFFGHFWPDAKNWLFPKPTLTVLYCLAQIGLCLYMFIVGLEFRTEIVRKNLKTAATVSIAGVSVPLVLGGLIAVYVLNSEVYFSQSVSLPLRALYLGASIAVTAFPVLARIIHEFKLNGTQLGTVVLAAGSIDDVAAWCLLAVVLSLLQGDPKLAILAIGGGTVFALFALTLGRGLLQKIVGRLNNPKFGKTERIAFVFVLLSLSAWTTETLGLHAVFGSFLMGVAFPRGESAISAKEAVEPFTTHLLLPIFFVYTGLNTRVDLLLSVEIMAVAALILVASCFGKAVACGFAARISGFSPADSVAVGALMNARGLMELIILNIGLEQGVITPILFSIMVLMAILTTVLASPLFKMTRETSFARSFGLKRLLWRKAP